MGLARVFLFWRTKSTKAAGDNLRPLYRWETVIPVKKLANRIYGFARAETIIQEVRKKWEGEIKLKRRRLPEGCFEIQKINQCLVLIGYTNHNTWHTIHTASNENPLFVKLFPVLWPEVAHLIGIPLTSIMGIGEESITSTKTEKEEVEILDIKTSLAIVNIHPH